MPDATAIGGECWRLGGVDQSCGQVCGGDDMVNLEGTTDGCWQEAVVLCLNDEVHSLNPNPNPNVALCLNDQVHRG